MKKPELIPEWRRTLRKAWSIRFIILAGLLTSAEILLPVFSDQFDRGTFAIATFFAVTGAFITRVLVQKDLDE